MVSVSQHVRFPPTCTKQDQAFPWYVVIFVLRFASASLRVFYLLSEDPTGTGYSTIPAGNWLRFIPMHQDLCSLLQAAHPGVAGWVMGLKHCFMLEQADFFGDFCAFCMTMFIHYLLKLPVKLHLVQEASQLFVTWLLNKCFTGHLSGAELNGSSPTSVFDRKSTKAQPCVFSHPNSTPFPLHLRPFLIPKSPPELPTSTPSIWHPVVRIHPTGRPNARLASFLPPEPPHEADWAMTVVRLELLACA